MHEIAQYAPIIIVLLAFLWQNNIFVKPEQLEKKHRKIIDEMTQRFVSYNAFDSYKRDNTARLERIEEAVNHIQELLMRK